VRVRFLTPPAKPCMRLSPHTAFHPSIEPALRPVVPAFLRSPWVRFSHGGFILAGWHSFETKSGHVRRSYLRVPVVHDDPIETSKGFHPIHRVVPVHLPVTFASGLSTNCRPSPCGRFSRPRTTTTAPTFIVVIGRLFALAFHGEPLTFPRSNSAGWFRWRFSADPSRSSRNPS